MKNVTISMDKALASAVRIEAAKAGMSMSKFLAEAARQKIECAAAPAKPERNAQLDALERFFDGPALHIAVDGKMPSASERNER